MKNTIILEVKDVFVTDFSINLPAPPLMESMEGGIRILFNDITEMKKYQEALLLLQDQQDENIQQKQAIAKLQSVFNHTLLDNQIVLDSIKAFAGALFSFIFNAEAHMQDKIIIFEAMVQDIRESTNSWELEKSLRSSTHELGILPFDHTLTFYNFAHNQIDYNFGKIKDRLIKELTILKLGLN
ncbi:hypothetical protein [Pedobacter frigoris]|uniref:hypothetical protein n=1 Tax=Pedobacter frigoris TaxID=2571272 RepID=UPI00292F0279|nr:hypothetical protein [Pedobacter frigoris]